MEKTCRKCGAELRGELLCAECGENNKPRFGLSNDDPADHAQNLKLILLIIAAFLVFGAIVTLIVFVEPLLFRDVLAGRG